MTGRGGEGKTRLALEFVARSRKEGWFGGVLRAGLPVAAVSAIGHAARPLVLVVDYVAARAAEVASLIQSVISARPRVPVRFLLLARAAGQWWDDFAVELDEDLPGLEAAVLTLPPLVAAAGSDQSPGPDAGSVFELAVQFLAPHLAGFTGRTPAELREIAARAQMPDMSGEAARHVLTVHMTALVGVLQLCDWVEPGGAGPEDVLLRHEQKYRNKLAERRGLDDLRSVRDRAVLAAALIGARGPSRPDARQAACAVVEAVLTPDLRGQVARQRDVAGWIAEIYPPDDPHLGSDVDYWGSVLPDRLCEFLVIRLLADEAIRRDDGGACDDATAASFLESLAGWSDTDVPGSERALLTLSRAAEHDMRAEAWLEKLVVTSPQLYGVGALVVATFAENPRPFRRALVSLGAAEPGILQLIAHSTFGNLDHFNHYTGPVLDARVAEKP